MSSNFFAALDDSGDEAPPKPAKTVEKKVAKPQPSVVEPSKVDQSKRPNIRGDRNTKFGRGSRAPARDGKRTYDRRSGTGRGKETKKGGGGARNWGSDKDEARKNEGHVDEGALEEHPPKEEETEENNEEPPAETEEVKEEEEEEAPEPEPEPEPEDKTMSYEEYMASRAKPDNQAFAPVKEREVTNEFAGLKVKGKDEQVDFLVLSGTKQKKKKKKETKERQTITPEFRVASATGEDWREEGGRGGRGRGRGGWAGGREGRGEGRGGRGGWDGRGGGRDGGRDGGRGRGGRGNGRGGRGGGQGRGREGGRGGGGGGINVMDESAFPSLG